MTRAEVKQAVLDALVSVVPEASPAQIDPAAPLREQLDIDSMDFINFVVALDDALGVDVPESEYGRLRTLDDCVDYLTPRLGGADGEALTHV
jgi:acyl carrier protein